MKIQGKEHSEQGFKIPADGWHIVEFQEGIDFLPGKGGEGIWQDEKDGHKAYKFPAKVNDENDPDNGADVTQIAAVPKGEQHVANILAAVGLFEAFEIKFPGDISVFDNAPMSGIKVKLPGKSCMIRTEIDKNGKSQTREMATFVAYKEIMVKGTEKKVGGGKVDSKTTATKPTTIPAASSIDW